MEGAIPPEQEYDKAKPGEAVLITGAAGFLGRHLCEHFLKRGYHVVGWDNFSSGRRQNFEELKAQFGRQFTGRRLDVCDSAAVQACAEEVAIKYILHFACLASPPWYKGDPIGTMMVGSGGALNMLHLALRKRARILIASTSEVYGDPKEPLVETYFGNANPVGVRSMYDESKRFQEALVVNFHRLNPDLQIRIARIFNTYGPYLRHDDQRVVSEFVKRALFNEDLELTCREGEQEVHCGTQTRSLCYVSDLISGLIALLEAPEPEYPMFAKDWDQQQDVRMPVNIGNPDGEIKIKELATKIIAMTGSLSKPVPRRDTGKRLDDPQERLPDITKAKKLLGWEPKVSMEEGLMLTIEHYQKVLADEIKARQGTNGKK